LKIDSENNIPSNDNKPQNKPKVFLPSIDLNNDYDQQLKVTFGGKINTTKTGNEEPYQEHLPIDPNHMANFQPPNESNQFVIPTNWSYVKHSSNLLCPLHDICAKNF